MNYIPLLYDGHGLTMLCALITHYCFLADYAIHVVEELKAYTSYIAYIANSHKPKTLSDVQVH